MRDAEIGYLGVDVGGQKLSNLRYADDTALLANSERDVDELVERVNEAGKTKLLNLNVKKTKLMRIDKRDEHKHEVKVNGVAIVEVESFKYLGLVETRFGDCSKDIKTRIAIAKRETLELTDIWKSRQIDKTVNIKLVKTLIWPIISYGAEDSTLSTANEKKLMAAEQWIDRRMVRVSWKERGTNESIFEQIGEAPGLLLQVVRRKLFFFFYELC